MDLGRRSKVYYPKVKLKVRLEGIDKGEDEYNKLRERDDKEFIMNKRIYKERVWDRNYYYYL